MEGEPDKLGNRRGFVFDSRWILIGFLAAAAFFLITEHRAHLLGLLPYALFLACPLMHMLHGHGRHRHDNGPPTERQHREK